MDVGTRPIGSLFPKLVELLLKDEYKLQRVEKRDLERLSGELKTMQLVLCKLAEAPREQIDYQVRLWAGNARDLSNGMEKDVDDILVLMEEGKEFTKKLTNLFMKSKTRYKIAHTIRDIEQRVLELSRGHDVVASLPGPSIGDLYTDEGATIGIENSRDELVKIVREGDHQLKIISVVGSGGLGKTTLAKAVYDSLKMEFDCSAFVPVSWNPDMKKFFMHILNDLDKQRYLNYTAKDENQVIYEIKKFLHDKRYLIVIDDLWDRKLWDIISLTLQSNDCRSRVIITTRVNSIAQCCSKDKSLIHEIMPLGYENSKRLFVKSCFRSEGSGHDTLTEVDEILKRCGGMPLAIKSFASAIVPSSARRMKEQWQEMMKSLHSVRGDLQCAEELTRILSYSYFDLPNTLRACLLYLAASAKNQRIQRDNLVRKWISEELIPDDKDCSRDELASRYFDELIDRNVIQPVKYVNCLGKEMYEVTYVMLYVLRLISREENFATLLSESEPHVNVRPIRLFMQCSDSEHSISMERVNLTNACSVTILGPAKSVSIKDLKYVRVLDLDGCEDIDNSAMGDICLMIQLKYLSLKQTQVTEIPPQISNLHHLENLAIRNAQITALPPQIGKLQNLERLDVRRTQISNLPPEVGNLLKLETLDVRQTQVKELPIEVLQLPKLEHLYFGQLGSLGGVKLPVGSDQFNSVKVFGTVDSREWSESAMEEISELRQVRELEVVLYDGPADEKQNGKLLSCISKCTNLQSLIIYGDSNPSDKLPTASANFSLLEKLIVAGRFLKVPQWISQLNALKKLDIRVCKLDPYHLKTLGDLTYLNTLALAMVCLPREQVVIPAAGFGSLVVFYFDCRIPWLTFQKDAMPKLEHLQLKLYAGPAGKYPSDIKHLNNLNMVILLYSSQYTASVGTIGTVEVMRKEAASHANLIELSINGDRERFPPSKNSDSTDTKAEIRTGVNRMTSGVEIEEVSASV